MIRRAATAGVLLVAGLAALTGCGDEEAASAGAAEPTAACFQTLAPVVIPPDADFPDGWAFPPGTVITETQQVEGGGFAVTAVVGADFEEVLPFMQHDLEDAGFVATQGEAEEDDAEATWTGGGFTGSWAIKASESCAGTTLLQVAAVSQ